MAKSVVKKKQRIAHNKACNEEHEMYPESDDFLSSIIEGMSNNDLIAAMYSNKFETNLPELNKSNKEKMQNHTNRKPNQNHVIMSKSKKFGLSRKFPLMEKSQRALKQIKHNMKIPKPMAHLAGLSDSPSFDSNSVLPEKSSKTKVLKGIKIARSKSKKVTEIEHNGLTCGNQIKKNNSLVSKDKDIKKIMKNSLPEESTQLKGRISAKCTTAVMKKKCAAEDSHLINNYNKTDDNSSDDDYDYEKFIQKEKKMLPKKSKMQTNKKSLKKVKKKDISRAVSSSLSKERDSDMTDNEASALPKSFKKGKDMKNNQQSNNPKEDDESESKKVRRKHPLKSVSTKSVSSESDTDGSDYGTSKPYCSKNKRTKKNHKVENSTCSITREESEFEMDINETTHHNSSSESEELPPPSEFIHGLSSSTDTHGNQFPGHLCNNEIIVPRSNLSSHETSKITSGIIKDEPNVSHNEAYLYKTLNKASLLNSDHPDPNKITDNSLLLGSNPPNILLKTDTSLLINDAPVKIPDVSFVVASDKHIGECASAKSNTSLNENSNLSLIVDLTGSDNECENSFTVLPEIKTSNPKQEDSHLHSDESDIELLDVIVPDLPKNIVNKNVPQCKNGSTNELNIKTEKVDLTHSVSIANPQNVPESNIELQTLIGKNEITYATGMCHRNGDKGESKDKSMKQLSLNNDNCQSNIVNSKDSLVLNKEVKEEPCDDCEIVLDSASTGIPSGTLLNMNNSKIKLEKEAEALKQVAIHVKSVGPSSSGKNIKLSQKEQKLHEVAVSNFRNSALSQEKKLIHLEQSMPKLHSVDVKTLLEDLKREFATYQDILQTEQSVEATFKMLEKCQAEKLMSLKKKITESLETATSINECNSIKNAMNKLRDISDLGNSKSLKECAKELPSVQDFKTLVTMNIVPLSCISENDVKPNLSELQRTVKQEPDNMSFGEKCKVCKKDASAACQQCAKVFFCSNECGRKYWEDGHKDNCVK